MEDHIDPSAFTEAAGGDIRALTANLGKGAVADAAERNAGVPELAGSADFATIEPSMREVVPWTPPDEDWEKPVSEIDRIRMDVDMIWRAAFTGSERTPDPAGAPRDDFAFRAEQDGGPPGSGPSQAFSLVHAIFGTADDFTLPIHTISQSKTRSFYETVFGFSGIAAANYLDLEGTSLAGHVDELTLRVAELETKVENLEDEVESIKSRLTAGGL